MQKLKYSKSAIELIYDQLRNDQQDEINDVNDIIEDIQDINWEEDFYEADTITDYNPTDMPIDIIYMDEDIDYGFETEEEVYELETENRYSRTKIKFNRVTGRLDEQIYFTKQNGDIISNYGYEYQCTKSEPLFER